MTGHHFELRNQFIAWYDANLPRLFNFVSYQLGDRSAAEEVTSQICERALTYLDSYDPRKGSLDTWMFTIARNTLSNTRRGQNRQPLVASLDAMPEVQSNGRSIEEIVERKALFKSAVYHIASLPESEQEIVALRYGAGFANREIAAMLGLTPNNVGVILHRALAKLREALQAENEAYHD